MPRMSLDGKRAAVNLRLDADVLPILAQLARSKKGYGALLSELLRDRLRLQEGADMLARIERLETLALPVEGLR